MQHRVSNVRPNVSWQAIPELYEPLDLEGLLYFGAFHRECWQLAQRLTIRTMGDRTVLVRRDRDE